MTTATEHIIKKSDDESRKRAFEHQMEDFIKRWRSDDRYDGAQFEAQLIMLMRQIYEDAQAPLLKQIMEMTTYMAVPTFPTKLTPI